MGIDQYCLKRWLGLAWEYAVLHTYDMPECKISLQVTLFLFYFIFFMYS